MKYILVESIDSSKITFCLCTIVKSNNRMLDKTYIPATVKSFNGHDFVQSYRYIFMQSLFEQC